MGIEDDSAGAGALVPAAAAERELAGTTGIEALPVPVLVLDTNVIFDWLIFADPSCRALRSAIEAREVRWIATPDMLQECLHVIGTGALDAWVPDTAALHGTWRDHCTLVATPGAGSFATVPRCSDADDQMFIDLAVACRARWLLSKDRAVLRLSGRLARLGVQAMSPSAWASSRGTATAG